MSKLAKDKQDKVDEERFDGEALAPEGGVHDPDDLNVDPEGVKLHEVGSNAEDPESAPEDEPALTVSEEGADDLDIDPGLTRESFLQEAADEVAPDLNYAEQDRLIAEATEPSQDPPAPGRGAAVADEVVVPYEVHFGSIVVAVDATTRERAVAVARRFLSDVAASDDFEVKDLRFEPEEVYPDGEDPEPADQVGGDTPSIPNEE